MNCLCCNKPLKDEEKQFGWHKACLKRFFNTDELPSIILDNKILEQLVFDSINKGYTVPGVQKKLSLNISSLENKPRLTLVNYPIRYILKPQVEEFESLPEFEHLCMSMAEIIGISTVPHALVKVNNEYAYITKRIDRIYKNKTIHLLAMEDFCQLALRLTSDKYKGSYERCAHIIKRYSSRSGLDLTELYLRLLFSFVMGNSDMHLKNFSLIEKEEGSGDYILSPAYDLLPVNIIIKEDKEQFALTMNGKKNNITKNDFLIFAEECGISKSSALKMINMLISSKEKLITMCNESLLKDHLKKSFITHIKETMSVFEDNK